MIGRRTATAEPFARPSAAMMHTKVVIPRIVIAGRFGIPL